MFHGIMLVLFGCLAASSLILAKKPGARALFDKVTPYQAIIGLVFALCGVWGFIQCLVNIQWLRFIPVSWVVLLLASVVEAALGFILGYAIISAHLLAQKKFTAEKGESLLRKIAPFQGKLGLAAIALGGVMIIVYIIYKIT